MKRWLPWIGFFLFLGCFLALLFRDAGWPGIRLPWGTHVFDTVVIDAGHGGSDPGAIAGGLVEKDVALRLALRLRSRLEALGFRTVLTRSDDTHLPLPARVRIANHNRNAILVSLHFNNSSSPAADGIETFYWADAAGNAIRNASTGPGSGAGASPRAVSESEALAGFLQVGMVGVTRAGDRGIKNRPLHVLRNARVPAVLVEAGFLSNPLEGKLIASRAYLESLAGAIARGVAAYRDSRQTMAYPALAARRAASN